MLHFPPAHLPPGESQSSNPWLFEAESLDNTPSFKDGIPKSQETNLRIDGAKFIQRLGNEELRLHYDTVGTGLVFFHRFYMFHSFRSFPVYPMAATCLFLAGKVEETPKKSNDIIRYSKAILGDQHYAQFGTDAKEEILTLERILLQTLRFDLDVEHPYKYFVLYKKHFVIVRAGLKDDQVHKDFCQSVWTFLNDSYCTTACLQYEPEIVAIAMILLACKTGSFEIYDWDHRQSWHRNWWDLYVENLGISTLELICHQVLDVYQYNAKREGQAVEPVS